MSCRSMTSVSISRSISSGLARFAVKRIHRHPPRLIALVRRLDHVVLDIGPEPVLRPEDAESDALSLYKPIDHMAKRVID